MYFTVSLHYYFPEVGKYFQRRIVTDYANNYLFCYTSNITNTITTRPTTTTTTVGPNYNYNCKLKVVGI